MFYMCYREEHSFGTFEDGEFFTGKSIGEALVAFDKTPAFSDRIVTAIFLVGKNKADTITYTKIKVDGLG